MSSPVVKEFPLWKQGLVFISFFILVFGLGAFSSPILLSSDNLNRHFYSPLYYDPATDDRGFGDPDYSGTDISIYDEPSTLIDALSIIEPAFVFGILWVIPYGMMVLSVFIHWRNNGFTGSKSAKLSLSVFVWQLWLGIAWSWLFFLFHLNNYAIGVLIILFILIAINIKLFYRTSKLAGLLLLPYLFWVLYVGLLIFFRG